MTGLTNPPLHPSEEDSGETARHFLAPLYGEVPAPDSREAAEFEATRDLLVDLIEEPAGAEWTDGARARLLERAFERRDEACTVAPLGGTVRLRRESAGGAIAFSSSFQAFPGDLLTLPAGSRAEVRMPDGSSILLKDRSRFVVGRIGGKVQGRLQAGRLYAWVEHQVRAAFRIATPLGTAAVVGTQFDLNLENHGECRLLVAKGQVNFETLPGIALGGGKRVEVAKNRMLRCSRTEDRLERLSPREIRRELGWVHGVPAPRRGRALLLILAILVIVGAGFFLMRSGGIFGANLISPAEDTQSMTGRQEALAIPPLSSMINESFRIRCNFAHMWTTEGSATMLCKVLEARPDSGAKFSVFLESIYLAQDPLGVVPGLTGRRFEYSVSPDGKQIRLASSDGKPIQDTELKTIFTLLLSGDISWFHQGGPVAPGQQATREARMSASGHPGAFLSFHTVPRFVGYAKHNGMEMALIESPLTVRMGGGLPVVDVPRPPATMRLLMDSFDVEGKALFWADPKSGRITGIEATYYPGPMRGRMQIYTPGRPVAEQAQFYPRDPKDVANMTTTIEYLP